MPRLGVGWLSLEDQLLKNVCARRLVSVKLGGVLAVWLLVPDAFAKLSSASHKRTEMAAR